MADESPEVAKRPPQVPFRFILFWAGGISTVLFNLVMFTAILAFWHAFPYWFQIVAFLGTPAAYAIAWKWGLSLELRVLSVYVFLVAAVFGFIGFIGGATIFYLPGLFGLLVGTSGRKRSLRQASSDQGSSGTVES